MRYVLPAAALLLAAALSGCDFVRFPGDGGPPPAPPEAGPVTPPGAPGPPPPGFGEGLPIAEEPRPHTPGTTGEPPTRPGLTPWAKAMPSLRDSLTFPLRGSRILSHPGATARIGLGEAPTSSPRHSPRMGGATLREEVDALEASLVREALAHTEGNQTKAAKQLGLSRYGLQKMMKRLGVEL